MSQNKVLVEKIKNMIISGYFKSGERLIESEIAKQFKISRTGVREALKILEKEGFLESEFNKGMKVKKFTFEEIKEYYEIRIALECLCVFLLIDQRSEELKENLRQNIILSEKALLEEDYPSLTLLGNTFHKTLHSFCGNKRLTEMLNNIRVISSIMRPPIWAFAPNRAKSTIEEHKKIAESIINDKRLLAVKHMRYHVINSYKNVEKYLKKIYFIEKEDYHEQKFFNDI
ncbi:MAG: GntR family transcriptional regulator [Caldisphaera sp.]